MSPPTHQESASVKKTWNRPPPPPQTPSEVARRLRGERADKLTERMSEEHLGLAKKFAAIIKESDMEIQRRNNV
ncbi:hypothetical protein OCU04_010597 [Sclerotinia nivalis]|uniref:Uncharacterized protein n=1 Tax=Sclerotinia nivalis TaxID=352851 RepID=A0A9X0DE66_9HELO|nr:hypothetical protein OCU04_010597 [Sclerotinia nivalis]